MFDPTWYAGLTKSVLTPPSYVFGPAWTILYILIAVSFLIVWSKGFKVSNPYRTKHPKSWNKYSLKLWEGSWQRVNIVAIFLVQLALNLLWSYIFFGLHNIGLAFFELVALWVSIVYLIVNFARVSRLAAWLLYPYLAWVTFAGYLNLSIWILSL